MFKIIKKGSNNFWHVFNNGAKNVSISDFEVVLDDVLNTFVIVLRNGANIPQIALSVLDIIVIDETGSGVEETFLTASQLRARLVVLGYTAYLGAGNADSITGLISEGTNVTITGTGTLSDPYVISSSGGSGTTPTLQEVVIEGNEIINTAGNLKIVLDKENNGVVLYELVSSVWEERGRYTSTDFQIGNGTGNYYILGSEFTGLTISNGTDSVQLTSNSITKNGNEVVTEVPYTWSGTEVDFIGKILYANEFRIKNTDGRVAVLKSDYLTDNRGIQFPDRAITVAGVDEIPTALSELSEDTTHRVVTDTEKSTWNGKEDISNKSSSYTSSSTTTYANTKALVDGLATKQDKMSWISSSVPYTGTTSTALQKLSNAGSSGNGSFPAKANTRYKIEIQFQLSGLSTTTNSVQFGILGTAGITSVNGQSLACKSATLISSNTPSHTAINTATISAALMTTGTQAFARAIINIEVVTSTSGTLIIAFATNVSTTPVVENHIIRFIELGASSTTSSSDIV